MTEPFRVTYIQELTQIVQGKEISEVARYAHAYAKAHPGMRVLSVYRQNEPKLPAPAAA